METESSVLPPLVTEEHLPMPNSGIKQPFTSTGETQLGKRGPLSNEVDRVTEYNNTFNQKLRDSSQRIDPTQLEFQNKMKNEGILSYLKSDATSNYMGARKENYNKLRIGSNPYEETTYDEGSSRTDQMTTEYLLLMLLIKLLARCTKLNPPEETKEALKVELAQLTFKENLIGAILMDAELWRRRGQEMVGITLDTSTSKAITEVTQENTI